MGSLCFFLNFPLHLFAVFVPLAAADVVQNELKGTAFHLLRVSAISALGIVSSNLASTKQRRRAPADKF